MSAPELIASYFTLAGPAVPFEEIEKEVSPHPLDDRIDAAAAAGFSGIGLSYPDLTALRRTMSFQDIRRAFDAGGLKNLELECIVDWHADGDRLATATEVKETLLACAAEIGACHIKVAADQNGETWPHTQMVDRFAALCEDAAAAGTRIVMESMPWSNVPDIKAAAQLVKDAGAANGGALFDIWHVARAGAPFEDLQAVPSETIGYIELCDALDKVTGTLKRDTIDNRRHCGEGELDVAGFVANVKATGYDGLWGVEVISEAQRNRGVGTAASLSYDAAIHYL
ncbi:sugar phosphate isomerase/epimerase family protein [Bauldia sp.]|uniref:sugar phosphate isomerase/epimerase family protein n=1 Tax=Bauldia sp. TaxID=2575872 RepID=UPI003BACF800